MMIYLTPDETMEPSQFSNAELRDAIIDYAVLLAVWPRGQPGADRLGVSLDRLLTIQEARAATFVIIKTTKPTP